MMCFFHTLMANENGNNNALQWCEILFLFWIAALFVSHGFQWESISKRNLKFIIQFEIISTEVNPLLRHACLPSFRQIGEKVSALQAIGFFACRAGDTFGFLQSQEVLQR